MAICHGGHARPTLKDAFLSLPLHVTPRGDPHPPAAPPCSSSRGSPQPAPGLSQTTWHEPLFRLCGFLFSWSSNIPFLCTLHLTRRKPPGFPTRRSWHLRHPQMGSRGSPGWPQMPQPLLEGLPEATGCCSLRNLGTTCGCAGALGGHWDPLTRLPRPRTRRGDRSGCPRVTSGFIPPW